MPDFTPGPANLVASGIPATGWTDPSPPAGVTLSYIVRAESDESCSSGPANGGTMDGNLVRVAVINETGLGGRDCLLFVFSAEIPAARAEAPLPPSPEGQLAWFEPERIPWGDCAPDLNEILPRVLATDRVLFGAERYEDGDRLTWLELG